MLSLLLSQEREIKELREELKAVGGRTPIKRNATLMQGKIKTKDEYLAFCTKLDDETIYNQMVSSPLGNFAVLSIYFFLNYMVMSVLYFHATHSYISHILINFSLIFHFFVSEIFFYDIWVFVGPSCLE